MFQAFNSSHTDDTDTEQNSTVVDTFCEPTPPPPPPTKKKKISQLCSMVRQLKEIADTTNSTVGVEENEFEVFGKHVGLQLKSLPLLLALEAQENIQVYLNRVRRQHLSTEQNRVTRTPQSSYATESPCSDSSIYYNDSNYNLDEQGTECILPTHHSDLFPLGHININETKNTTISNDLILTAMQNANVDNQK